MPRLTGYRPRILAAVESWMALCPFAHARAEIELLKVALLLAQPLDLRWRARFGRWWRSMSTSDRPNARVVTNRRRTRRKGLPGSGTK